MGKSQDDREAEAVFISAGDDEEIGSDQHGFPGGKRNNRNPTYVCKFRCR